MSRDVPLLASEKIKLGILIGIVLLIVSSLVSGAWKKLYRVIVRDKKSYERVMNEMCDYYHFTVHSFDDSMNTYKLDVDSEHWKVMTKDGRFNYCDNCFNSIRKAQVMYKMKDEGDDPILYFFVNNNKMAQVAYGYTTVN